MDTSLLKNFNLNDLSFSEIEIALKKKYFFATLILTLFIF